MIVLFLCTNYSILVGKKNRYDNSNKEKLNILEKLKMYRTYEDGNNIFIILDKK